MFLYLQHSTLQEVRKTLLSSSLMFVVSNGFQKPKSVLSKKDQKIIKLGDTRWMAMYCGLWYILVSQNAASEDIPVFTLNNEFAEVCFFVRFIVTLQLNGNYSYNRKCLPELYKTHTLNPQESIFYYDYIFSRELYVFFWFFTLLLLVPTATSYIFA